MSEAMMIALALLALRIGLGVELIVHGWPKFKGHAQVVGMLQSAGLKPAGLLAWLLALQEFVGGLAILFGLFTRVAAVLTTVQFLVIILYVKPVKWKVPFATPQGQAGWEWDWLILAMSVALVLAGAGQYGLDRALGMPL